jgi:chromosome segregation ATPase
MKNILNMIDKGIEKLTRDVDIYKSCYEATTKELEAARAMNASHEERLADFTEQIQYLSDGCVDLEAKLSAALQENEELRRRG